MLNETIVLLLLWLGCRDLPSTIRSVIQLTAFASSFFVCVCVWRQRVVVYGQMPPLYYSRLS